MWLKEFYDLFDEATQRRYGYVLKIKDIENKPEVQKARNEGYFDANVLRIIEESPEWEKQYPWPSISDKLKERIILSGRVSSKDGKSEVVEKLYEKLKNIDVVSVVLRFLFPEEFGIISPPILSLINLVPSKVSMVGNHINYYLNYIDALKGFCDHYKILSRVADVDMALWSAGILSSDVVEYAAITEEMYEDEYFQKVRIENLLAGLKLPRKEGDTSIKEDRYRLIFSQALLKQDYLSAAIISVIPCERLIMQIGEMLGIFVTPKKGQSKFSAVVDRFIKSEILTKKGFVFSEKELDSLRDLRNKAAHPFDAPISKSEANKFVDLVLRLQDIFYKLSKQESKQK